jgi:hypothetical protein
MTKRVRLIPDEVVEQIADKYIASDGTEPKPKKRGRKPGLGKMSKEVLAVSITEKPKTKPERKKPGPPSTYKPEYAKIAKLLCARGATNAVLADAFSVNTSTIFDWQARHDDFAEAMAKGKAEIFDPLVERALAQRAIGYSVDTEEVKITKDGDEIRYQLRKHFAPDTTACIFWLKNRQPEKWRDVYDYKHGGKVEFEAKSAEELLDEIKREVTDMGLVPEQAEKLIMGVAAPNGKGTKH